MSGAFQYFFFMSHSIHVRLSDFNFLVTGLVSQRWKGVVGSVGPRQDLG